MKNMNSKTKTLLITGCLAIVCVVLIAAISSKFQPEPLKDDLIPPSNTVSDLATPNSDTAKPDETTEKKDDVVVKPVETSTPQGDTPAQDSNEIVQTDAPEAVKPEPPAKPTPQSDETNPSKPPEYKPEDTTVSKPAEPKGGEKKDGKIYVPGFGWIEDNGGGGKGELAEDMYENGNKIGVMD